MGGTPWLGIPKFGMCQYLGRRLVQRPFLFTTTNHPGRITYSRTAPFEVNSSHPRPSQNWAITLAMRGDSTFGGEHDVYSIIQSCPLSLSPHSSHNLEAVLSQFHQLTWSKAWLHQAVECVEECACFLAASAVVGRLVSEGRGMIEGRRVLRGGSLTFFSFGAVDREHQGQRLKAREDRILTR